jgi:hypothetical protein
VLAAKENLSSNPCTPCRGLSIGSEMIKLPPYFITGFSDAESSFIISIRTNNKLKTG